MNDLDNYFQHIIVAESMVTPILEAIYFLVNKSEIDGALDLLFNVVDLWYKREEFIFINKFLELTNLDKLDITLMIGFLSITLVDKEKIVYRPLFYNKIKQK